MSNEATLLQCWRELPPESQERVLEYAVSLHQTSEPVNYQAQTSLGKKLLELRQQAISEGIALLSTEQVAEELANRQGGFREP